MLERRLAFDQTTNRWNMAGTCIAETAFALSPKWHPARAVAAGNWRSAGLTLCDVMKRAP